ncbi:flagellar basal-body rod protein FlgF [Pseudodesulfovibrio senegalensis]|uniref:Flagellar basal-body rod protein FlgF n=1 Tax=Pseudodesulfovibrio senegalensis TaxID=1721087 RepID=A0A6N6MZW0_9BACT|nr:flagellar basal-body rod protein FlgF [Pseudodesulfovibrio senegalensis]KAB1440245.1 flagellar basal-body rod protein FlgF [Pseudodesulfovibrio senegalensis]
MRDSSFSALFGALSNELRMSTVANNLANANTTAYKKDKIAFHDTFQRFAHDYLGDAKPYLRDKDLWPRANVMARPRLSDQQIDFTQGSLQQTGNQLDMAISGDGFFKVQIGDEQLLTRAGNFVVDAEGTLMTPEGNPVIGGGGPVNIPPTSRVVVDGSGGIIVDGALVARMDVVTVSDLNELEKVGKNCYRLRSGSTADEIPAEDCTVEQGYLEKGNVEVVTEMVAMIETQRSFEAYSKVIKGDSELDTKLLTQVGRAT